MTALGKEQSRFTVLILVAETPNDASLTAFRFITQLLRAGQDVVHLVRIVLPAARTG